MNDWSDRTAIVAESCLTHQEIRQQSATIGRALAAAGLRPGAPVAVAISHRTSFYVCFAACFEAGFPVVVLDPAAATMELVLMLQKARSAALVADAAVLERLAGQSGFDLPEVVWETPTFAGPSKVTNESGSQSIDDDIPAYVIFTSGTTSAPKGVVVSRSALRRHVATLSNIFGYNDDARLLSFLPTHHTDGLVHGVAASLLTGMTVVQPGPFTQTTDLEQLLRANKISHFLTVPTMLAMIKRLFADRPGLFRYKEFAQLVSTAGLLDDSLWQEFQDWFDIRISNFYGMTETVSGALYCGPDDITWRLGTLGKPIDADIRIVAASGAMVATGAIGELQISAPHLMTGYLGDPKATDAVLTDGWLSTGDLCSQDEDGFLRFHGRLKNIIKRGGITVYPEDIGMIVAAIPGVLEVEVVGIPDPTFEQIIVVCAVAESNVSAADIRAACRANLAPERRPDRIELLQRLPRGPSGKVRRELLVKSLGGAAKVAEQGAGSLRERIIEVAAHIFDVPPANLNEGSSPETVENWDSYAGMEFVLALEKEFSVRLRPRDIMRMSSVGKAIEIVISHAPATGTSN